MHVLTVEGKQTPEIIETILEARLIHTESIKSLHGNFYDVKQPGQNKLHNVKQPPSLI